MIQGAEQRVGGQLLRGRIELMANCIKIRPFAFTGPPPLRFLLNKAHPGFRLEVKQVEGTDMDLRRMPRFSEVGIDPPDFPREYPLGPFRLQRRAKRGLEGGFIPVHDHDAIQPEPMVDPPAHRLAERARSAADCRRWITSGLIPA